MKNKMQYFAAAVVIMTVACSACKGRYADSAPNGETVELKVVQPSVQAPVDSDGMMVSAAGPEAPVVTEVVTISDAEAQK